MTEREQRGEEDTDNKHYTFREAVFFPLKCPGVYLHQLRFFVPVFLLLFEIQKEEEKVRFFNRLDSVHLS